MSAFRSFAIVALSSAMMSACGGSRFTCSSNAVSTAISEQLQSELSEYPRLEDYVDINASHINLSSISTGKIEANSHYCTAEAKFDIIINARGKQLLEEVQAHPAQDIFDHEARQKESLALPLQVLPSSDSKPVSIDYVVRVNDDGAGVTVVTGKRLLPKAF